MEVIQPRFHTMKFNFPRKKEKRKVVVNTLLAPFKLIVAVGLPGTGKSTFLSYYDGKPDCTLTKWNREPIFNMIFAGGERDEKYNNHIQQLEQRMITDLLAREHHQVVVDGWHRLPRSRTQLRSYGNAPSVLLVFDGPVDKIVDRVSNMKKYSHMSKEDLRLWIQDLYKTMVWPTAKENFHTVIYINTFGKEGGEYLSYRLITQS